MKNKKNRKVKLAVICAFALILLAITNIYATYQKVDFGKYRIQAIQGSDKYISYEGRPQKNTKYTYVDNNNKRHYAYCIELGLKGAEHFEGGYDVNGENYLTDKILNNILLNGYPYKSIGQIGVNNENEAVFATQFAVWIYTAKLDINKILPLNANNQNVVNAIKNIYQFGTNFVGDNSSEINFFERGQNSSIDDIDRNYLKKEYSVTIGNSIESISFKDNNSQVKLVDMNNNKIDNLVGKKQFKLLFPINATVSEKNYPIVFDIVEKETSVIFGKTDSNDKQNVLLTLNPLVNSYKTLNVKFDYKPANLKIVKYDEEDKNIRLDGVTFKITNLDTSEVLGSFTTDENGEICIDGREHLKIFNEPNLKIEEISTKDGYYFNPESDFQIIKLEHEKTHDIIFTNKKIKGKIEITKISSNYNEITKLLKGSKLEGAQYGIYDINNNLIDKLITNKEGRAISKELYKGKYTVKEIKEPENYILNSNEVKVEIKDPDCVLKLEFENDSKPLKKELPKTGI